MNQPFSGGWRFGGSNEALAPITNQGISPEFLKKVASLGLLGEQDKPALEKAVTPDALSGLLDSPGSGSWGGDQERGATQEKQGGGYVQGPDGNTYAQTSPGGLSVGFNPNAMKMSLSPLSTIMSGVTMKQTPANYSLQYYGAPNMSWADALTMAAKANGGLIGDVSFGGGGDYGLTPGGFGDYGSSLGNAAGLGLDANSIGDGYGFGGLSDW